MTSASSSARPGRPRASVDAEVFAATLRTIDELGYTRATVDRIAAAAGIAKTTIYRRWPSKGALVTACLVDTFGPLPLTGASRSGDLATAIRYGAAKIGEPGVAAAFAGVFTDAIGDPALRELLAGQLQEPYRVALHDALGEPDQRILFLIDVVIGTLLHRMGMTGEPMVDADVDALINMLQRELG
ncbi:TetR/AcrR family transcriptional regulator [Kribbella solani]|uniref:TetR/AcrR family transcriptional regulator n=1 Tax=Kribbella solani TaxID=236067 RepID=UPI0029A5BCE6|nr:TetR/AcrR family transcriptional regulator [Kribbella solani]MDX2971542.1 TetR/AcrR family transcriptional regulator [Kribbella solani]MDX3002820.1 TetR/AcrR family transcriptional regulator [Kribbella solani]